MPDVQKFLRRILRLSLQTGKNQVLCGKGLTLSETNPGVYVCSASLFKTRWEKEKLLVRSNSPFPTVFSTHFDNFLPFLSNLKLLSANSFSCEVSKICGWERVYSVPHNQDFKVVSCYG